MLFASIWHSYLVETSVLLLCQYTATLSREVGGGFISAKWTILEFLEIFPGIDLVSIIYVRHCSFIWYNDLFPVNLRSQFYFQVYFLLSFHIVYSKQILSRYMITTYCQEASVVNTHCYMQKLSICFRLFILYLLYLISLIFSTMKKKLFFNTLVCIYCAWDVFASFSNRLSFISNA